MVGMVEGSDEVCGRGVMSMTSKEASVLRRCKRSCRGGFRRTGQKAPWLVFFALLMLMSPAGSFSPPTPAVGSGRHAVRQHAMLGNIREGMSGALISFFGSRLTPVSFGGGGGRAESTSMRRVINADQEDAELVIIRTMEASDMKGADSKLMDAAKLCVSEMFGTNEGWDAVGQGFLLKYGKKLDNMGLSLMPAPEYSHGMCTMLSAELASGELVGCAGVDLARITAKGTPAWSGVHDVALLRPFLSDLVVRNSHRGMGLGRALLEECERLVRVDWESKLQRTPPAFRVTCDLDKIYLKVDMENEAAIRLYSAAGYVEVRRVSEPALKVIQTASGGKRLANNVHVTHIFLCKELASS